MQNRFLVDYTVVDGANSYHCRHLSLTDDYETLFPEIVTFDDEAELQEALRNYALDATFEFENGLRAIKYVHIRPVSEAEWAVLANCL